MKKILSILIPVIAAVTAAYGAVVTGRVTDSQNSPLPGASVSLTEFPDSTARDLIMAGADGNFSFKNLQPGNYAVRVSMVGMDSQIKSFIISDTTRKVSLPTFVLTEEATMLKEAVVTAVKAAVVAKQDTMEFNAESFKTAVNSNVEDLLKKLPGVEVGSDGSITSGGKTVTKILVDGKEFFSDDPTMASKNLPSNMVDKIQVVDRKSDLARLTGVDDGEEETVINLTVKKSMKNGWFGNVSGGYGTDKHYEGSFNVSTFTNNNQISFIGGANNINDLGFSDMGRGRFMNFGNSGGLTSSQRFGVNFNVGKSEKFRVGGNVFYTHSDRTAESRSDTRYLFTDSTSYQNSKSYSRDRGHNVRGDFRMEWKIDDYNTIDFRPRFGFNSRGTEMNQTTNLFAGDGPGIGADRVQGTHVNMNDTKKYNHGLSYEASGELIYNHNFKSRPGRSFSTQLQYSFSDTKQRTTSWNDIEYFLKEEDSGLVYRYLDSKQWNNTMGVRLTWTEPLGDVARGNFLQVAYRLQYKFNNADKYTYDLPSTLEFEDFKFLPSEGVENDQISNRFRNTFSTHEVRVGYKKVQSKYNLEAGMMFAPSSSKSTDLINPARNIETRWVWNVAPYARFRYKFSNTKSLRANYRANSSMPTIAQLQPVQDVSDPMHITQGNPNLKPTFTQSLHFNFNNYNQETQQSMFAMLRGSYTQNVVVSKTTTNRETGQRFTTYENANGNMSVNGMFMVNQPLRNRHWRFSARAMANFSSSAGYINEDFNRSGNLRIAPNFGMTYSCDIFQMSARPTYTFSLATSSLPQQQNRTTHTYGFTADATLTLPFGLEFSSDVAFDKSTGYSQGYNTTSWLWNAKLSYSTLRDKSLTFYVRAYDILGQVQNISRSVSANQIVDSWNNSLSRYIMVGVTWKFNTLKNKKQVQETGPDGMPIPEGMRRQGMPMGPPPGGMGGMRPF